MKNQLVVLLCHLNAKQQSGQINGIAYGKLFAEICRALDVTYELIADNLSNITTLNFSKEVTDDWKCICLSFYIIKLLNSELEESDVLLSVQQTKDVKKCLRNIVEMGISTRLQYNLPLFIKPDDEMESGDIFWNYNVLKCVTFELCELFKAPNLRLLFLPECLKEVLVAVLQISFCPLKKPTKNPDNQTNAMTEDIYIRLTKEKDMFVKILDNLKQTIHPNIFLRELMIIFQDNSPNWFKRSISKILTAIIRSENGVEHIASALFVEFENDSTQTWMILDVFSRLILSCRGFPDFQENTCKQLVGLLEKTSEDSSIYERAFAHCAKSFYKEDQESAKVNFVRPIISFFIHFTYGHNFEDGAYLTRKLKQNSRLIHSLFVQNTVENPALPLKILKPVSNVIFRFYALTSSSSLKTINNDLMAILIGYFRRYPDELFVLFDSFLFGINTAEILPFRNDISVQLEEEGVILRRSEYSVFYSSAENSCCLLGLVKSDSSLTQKLFGFLLKCLTNGDKYFNKGNAELLELEEEMMNQFFERKITVYRLLSEMAEDKSIQEELSTNPHDVLRYIKLVLERTLEIGTHKTTDADSDEYQSLFTTLMILQSLIEGSDGSNYKITYSTLLQPLREISEETANVETSDLINRILEILEGRKYHRTKNFDSEKTDLDKAIEDVCDPLLPVRGHGLMTLTKLVEKKDRHVMERKNYVLNVFQQNLKNEDSFIYLSAIGGLAALADVFPDSVLHIICEEYSDFSRKATEDGHEVRIKLGECLVRTTKTLGEMAPKYKPLLLNTFLVGAKEDDDIIRASSLSNLGEICRVLGYKLGSIVTEVLVCVHAIIATDKSPQARRAAVSVIRQLFVGLDKEMIAFLKDDILTIYRTLKDVYNNDVDDVMRLQSQLALEELNENMKSFVFATPKLHDEKKIVMLN